MRIDQLPLVSSVGNNDTMPASQSGLSVQVSVGDIANAIRSDVYGAPLTASQAADMTDQTKVYVYTGTTSGSYTNGHWYYWDGTAWTDGGTYNSTAVQTDATLTLSGVAADAKAAGDGIRQLDTAVAPTFDASTSYLSGSYVWYDGKLYRFTADHTGAWASADAVKVDVGGELCRVSSEIDYDMLNLNCGNIIDAIAKANRSAHNVKWTWSGNRLSANGQANATENYNLFSSQTALPAGIVPGGTYRVLHSTTKVVTKVYDYTSGTVELFNSSAPGEFTVPTTCAGLIIRLTVGSGVTANETFVPCIIGTKTNAELAGETDELAAHRIADLAELAARRKGDLINVDKSLRAMPIDRTVNLIDATTLTDGYILINNVPTTQSGYWYSDYIDIEGLPFCYKDQGDAVTDLISCYDANQAYIGEISHNTNAEYYERVIDSSKPSNYYKVIPLPGTMYVRVNGRWANKLMLTPLFYPDVYVPFGETYTKNALKVCMFGDSITLGTNGDTASPAEKNMQYWMRRLTPYVIDNMGVGSMGWVATTYNPQIAYDKISATDLTGYDVITLCYGVNDSAATMGTYDSTDETTIMGQVNKCIKYIGAQNPGARIILIAPWNGRKYGAFPDWRYAQRTSGGFTRQELSDELKKVADYYYIGFIDQRDCPVNGFGLGTVSGEKTGPYLGADNVHPSEAGYKAIGEWLSAKLMSLVI